jgi:hypothetical protein
VSIEQEFIAGLGGEVLGDGVAGYSARLIQHAF